ncbi:MAG: N-acetylneuraminate synthase family protein [Gammaproteobacteria bacterium]|nr:N-acetylneuraminate synthase family protein [Gammaproteobacteria bacterium]
MIDISGKKIGNGEPCFITFEAGPTHSGVESAKRLIDHASAAGASAIKFQITNPDRLVANRQQQFSYNVLVNRETGEESTISEPLYDLLMRRYLTHNQWREVKAHADKRGLAFFATAGFQEDIEFLVSMGCASIKVASADVTHLPLLRFVAGTGMVIQLDTGNSTLGEIEKAVDTILGEGNDKIIIHQCPSGYPARIESINLRIITTLKQMFPTLAVAFSDHTPGWEMDVAAVALGAHLLEKTITEDRTTRSVEHIMSLEPDDMSRFIQTIRSVEIALGNTRRLMSQEERDKACMVRRSIFIREEVTAGTRLSESPLEFRRPGNGIPVEQYDFLSNAYLRNDLAAGHQLRLADLVWEHGK